MREAIQRIKDKWQIDSDRDFILIMAVFSLAGLGVSMSRKYIFALFGLTLAPVWEKVLISILLIIPLYQLSTLVFAFPLGQFSFFWNRQKELGRFMRRSLQKIFFPSRQS